MRPKERRDSGENDFFKARLDQIIDMDRALAKLGRTIDWRFLEERFGAVYSDKVRHPPLPTRLMAGLSILKHMHDLSDEDLRARWIGESVLPGLLRRGVLPAQADLRPLVADPLAPADGGAAPCGADPGKPVGCDANGRSQARGFLQGHCRHHCAAQGDRLSDRRQADASGARAAGEARQENRR
jgi:hypothetical protein